MKPQPPVTKMRISARNSSARKGARAEFSSPILRALDGKSAFWTILILAAALRFLFLGIKPPHFDEGINGWFVDQMVSTGYYKYDPTNYHGPLHFYVLLVFQSLFGRNLWALRLPVVLVSMACVWLTLHYDRVLPRAVARLAALTMAISPAFVFYGRYSIHEVWLLLFSMMFMLGLLGLWRHGALLYLWFTGLGLAGMILTKETYIIHLGCAIIAIPLVYVSNLLHPGEDKLEPAEQKWDSWNLLVVGAVSVGLVVFFYSGTFFHWSGVKGLYQTFRTWFKTGSDGNGHGKPFYYWIELLARYEWPLLAGLILCSCVQLFRSISLRYLAIIGVGVLIAYSIVNYKTPWCIISIAWPLLFVFAAFVLLVPATRLNLAFIAAGLLLLVSLGFSINLNYFRCSTFTDATWNGDKSVTGNLEEFFTSEPYVYVQTYNDIYKLTTPVLTLARRNPIRYHMVGHIIRPSPYPLPWILDDFPGVGYYEHENLPPQVDADFLLVEEDRVAEVESKLLDSYFTMPLTIRPYQDTSKLYLRARTFQGFFPDRLPDFLGKH